MNEQNNIPQPEIQPDAAANLQSETPAALLPAKPFNRFELVDVIYALGCFLLGYLFMRFAAVYSGGICGGIFWALTGALSALYVKIKKFPVTKWHVIVFSISEVFCLTPLFCTNRFVNTLAALFSYLLLFYLAAAVSGAELFGKNFVTDILSSVLARPFSNFAKAPAAAIYPLKDKAKNVVYIVIGLIAAVPLTVVVVALLQSADDSFRQIFMKISTDFTANLVLNIWWSVSGILVGMYLFGSLFSVGQKRESAKEGSLQILPAMVAYTAVTPVCVFYVIYIISQLQYFTAAFGGVLPEGYSYSSFARKGFFELCVIAVINLGLIAVMQVFAKRRENGSRPTALKIYTVVISVLTLLLIASAFSKMAMYIAELGMTQLRIYTAWFMIVLCAAFVLMIIWQFKDVKFWRIMFGIFTVMFALLCFGQTDRMIARYNVTAYMRGSIESLDFDALSELSEEAVLPVADMLKTNTDERLRRQALEFFADELMDSESGEWAYFSIPSVQAREVYERYDVESLLHAHEIY